MPERGEPDSIGGADTAAAERIGGRYEVLGWIGAGGMGNVYRVRDRELDEVVALKMLRRELVGDPDSLARFRREVKLARRVTHRNVARTFDIGEHAGEVFLTMELVDGEPLSRTIARGALETAIAVDLAIAVCAGLSAAHAAGVMHRDLKPDNVLIAPGPRVVITDFGIACGEGGDHAGFAGTPAYMAPEQVEGIEHVDARADVYALGVVLYEMVTGAPAWRGPTPLALASARLTQPPPDPRALRPGLPGAVAEVILRCLARAPADRFAGADEVAAALRAAGTIAHDAARAPGIAMPVLPRPTDTAVAVLPLRNAGDAADDYVADGLTDDLIDTLSMTGGLRVRPRGIVAAYPSGRGDPRVIGGELGVQVVVEGSVRKLGDGVRLQLRVISVAEGFQLWARRIDAAGGDLLVAIDDAARAIAAALTVAVQAPVREVPADTLAIDLYLRARQEYRRSWHSSMTLAVDLFEQALARAPTHPDILTGCALARARMAFFQDAAPGPAAERARVLAERAVQLAPHVGDSWAALYSAHINASDPLGAAQVLRRGVTTAPKSPLLQEMLGRLLLELGDATQAILRLEAALVLDPTAVAPEFELARAHALLGDWTRVDDIHARPMLDAGSRAISRARLALWRRAPAPVPPDATPPSSYQRLWAQVLTTPSLDDDQRAFMADRVRTASGRLRTLFWQRNAEVFAFVGDEDAARDAVTGALDAGLIDLLWIDRCPLLASLRSGAAWRGLRERVVARVAPIAAALDVAV